MVNKAKQEIQDACAYAAALHPAYQFRFLMVAINLVAPCTASLRHLIGALVDDNEPSNHLRSYGNSKRD